MTYRKETYQCRNSYIDRVRSLSPECIAVITSRLLIGSTIATRDEDTPESFDRMPFNSESSYNESCQEFCLALKATRERKGITLAQIASATKIPAYMFAALERGDLRRWPKGLFRRSFFRDYARMIGLPPAEACDEFVRLFPDDPGVEKAAGAGNDGERASDLRLAFDTAWHGPRASVLSRLLAVLIDAGTVTLLAVAIAWMAGMDRPTTAAIVALVYFSLATALFGESPAKWAISRRRSIIDALTHGTAVVAAAWRRSADAISSVLGSAGTVTPEPPQRLRVRVKMSQ
jgi:Helix-turn-helix domain